MVTVVRCDYRMSEPELLLLSPQFFVRHVRNQLSIKFVVLELKLAERQTDRYDVHCLCSSYAHQTKKLCIRERTVK
jgi:hypothetical protein